MFSTAYEIASAYTQPVLVSHRFFNGEIESGLGSFIIINDEGWIITAAHIIEPMNTFQQHSKEMHEYKQQISAIDQDPTLNQTAKFKKKKRLQVNQKWLTAFSHWWGKDSHRIMQFKVFKENDIAIGKIENYDPGFCKSYPVFRDPLKLKVGTSVCKLGFPFFNVKATFDEQKHAFQFDRSIFPIPRFPIDGIVTRMVVPAKTKEQNQNLNVKFIETSTPGLRGQSGGPIFDVEGRVLGVQSHTRHLPLGFSPKIKKGGKEVEENQFINIGIGAHVESILTLLDQHGVRYEKG
ncbi:MAG: serine protease [Bacteroidota bacterium]